MTKKIFLSYRSSDSALADQVAESLRSSGLVVEDARSMLVPGDVWAAKLGSAINDSDAVVVLIPDDDDQPSWIYTELARALRANKLVVPVLIDKDTEVPPLLAPFQYVDISDWATRRDVLSRLGTQLAERSNQARNLDEDLQSVGERIEDLREVRAASEFVKAERVVRRSTQASAVSLVVATASVAAAAILQLSGGAAGVALWVIVISVVAILVITSVRLG